MQQFLLFAQEAGEGAAWFAGGFMLFWILLAVVAFVVWLWALVDAIRNPALDSNERLLWVLVIVIAQFIGAIIYFIIGKNKTAGATAGGSQYG